MSEKKKCTGCGNQIEKDVRVCPHCGKKRANVWKIVLTMTLILITFSGCYLSIDYGIEQGIKKSTPLYKIGDIGPAGGWIFYDKWSITDGWRYLEAAPVNTEFNAEWCSIHIDISGTQTGIGKGKRNTELIVQAQNNSRLSGMVAQKCVGIVVNGYSDWFLPSKDELSLMYIFLHNNNGIGNFEEGNNKDDLYKWIYWSSSQFNYDYAWCHSFGDGSLGYNNKTNAYFVRAVRAF